MWKIYNFLSLDSGKGLGQQPLFWLVILLPIAIAICLGLPLWLEYRLAFTGKAYETFLEISKLPIGISSLAIPLGILIGRLHGTKQTAKQIENTLIQIRITEQDNKSKLYLAHFDHFCTHIDFMEKSMRVKFIQLFLDGNYPELDKISLYRMLYPQNSLVDGVNLMSDSGHLSQCFSWVNMLSDYYNDTDISEYEFIWSIEWTLIVLRKQFLYFKNKEDPFVERLYDSVNNLDLKKKKI